MRQLIGDPRKLSESVTETVTLAALKQAGQNARANNMPVRVADGSLFRFLQASALTADDELVVAPAAGAGRYVRDLGPATLEIPFDFSKADGAPLLTIPTGFVLAIEELYWRVETAFTGGASSAIGVSATGPAGYTTKGDLLGGATGDVAATLVAGTPTKSPIPGTIGTQFDTIAKRRALLLKPTNTLRFDRITSAFTAGAGAVIVKANILRSPAAALAL